MIFLQKNERLLYPLLLSLLFVLPSHTLAKQSEKQATQHIDYTLAVSFDIAKKKVIGTARLKIPAGQQLSLMLNEINPTGVVLNREALPPASITLEKNDRLTVPADHSPRELLLSFEKAVMGERDNFISPEAITLLNNWFPRPQQKVLFTLQATLPEGFTAVTESDSLPPANQTQTKLTFSTPATSLHLVAAPFVVNRLEVRKGLQVATYFYEKDRHLARGYLEAAREYLRRYESLVGPYPYNHFAIVENVRPTGYGMPTFTLLGRQVIRLPFIKHTSLGHEILHSWFGNSIDIGPGGNWSEGLTTYLADWLYREDAGEGALNRKERINDYLNTTAGETIPLQLFSFGGPNDPAATAMRSVGYTRGAMLFHELRRLIGDNLFYEGIRTFYRSFRGKEAGWQDIREVYEEVSGEDLKRFFQERLQRDYIADLAIKDVSSIRGENGMVLQLTVVQQSPEPFQLQLPIKVQATNHSSLFTRIITKSEEIIRIPLSTSPETVVIDPNYDLMRTLEASERIPSLSSFLGPKPSTVVSGNEDKAIYLPLLDHATASDHPWQQPEEVKNSELGDLNLVLLGQDNILRQHLFGQVQHHEKGVTLEVRKNPLNHDRDILLITSSSAEQTQAILRKLRHYGKYSYIHAVDGRVMKRRIEATSFGKHFQLNEPPRAIPAKKVLSFDEAMQAASESRVIYVGERHTSMADHHLQRLVIEYMIRQQEDIAIGMEMFPSSSQEALRNYTLAGNSVDERAFLKNSRYFRVWNFDYRYYKPLLDLAKERKLPVIALNVDKDITSSIFRHGSTDQLTQEQRRQLPEQRDLSLPGYYQRLQSMHDIHMRGGHGGGRLAGFIQAQAIWDEAMAENIAEYLAANAQRKMIVLAGTQHTRKDSGLPPRVKRRLDLRQTVLTTYDGATPPALEQVDYYFYVDTKPLAPAGKIGISLEEKEEMGETSIVITGFSEGGNAHTAGLRQGDIITVIDGYTIDTMEDVRIAMVGAKPEDKIIVEVGRSTGGSQKRHSVEVSLHAPARERGIRRHPDLSSGKP